MSVPENHYHAVQFYKDDASLAKTVARFFEDGLRAGEPAVMIATPSHTKAILRALSVTGCNVQSLRRTGRLQTLDATRSSLLSWAAGRLTRFSSRATWAMSSNGCAEDRRPCPIRAYGEMVDLLWQRGNTDAAIRLEILWNQLASNYEFSLMCGYAVGQFYKETRDPRYEDICAQHSDVLPA